MIPHEPDSEVNSIAHTGVKLFISTRRVDAQARPKRLALCAIPKSSAMADRYTKGQMLGKGSFGAAYLVTCKADGQKYVLKEIDISRMQRVEREAAEQEAKVRCTHSKTRRALRT